MRTHQVLLDRMHRLHLHALMVGPLSGPNLPRRLPAPPSPHLNLRTGGGANGNHGLCAQDLLGVLLVPLSIIALVGDDELHPLVRCLHLLQDPDGVRRVVRWTHPELHHLDELLPRLHSHRLLEIMTHGAPPTRTSEHSSSLSDGPGVLDARRCWAEPSRIEARCSTPRRVSSKNMRRRSTLLVFVLFEKLAQRCPMRHPHQAKLF